MCETDKVRSPKHVREKSARSLNKRPGLKKKTVNEIKGAQKGQAKSDKKCSSAKIRKKQEKYKVTK